MEGAPKQFFLDPHDPVGRGGRRQDGPELPRADLNRPGEPGGPTTPAGPAPHGPRPPR